MSENGVVQQIIDRALEDEAFRKLLISDPDKALEGYTLTDEQRKLFEGLDEEKFDAFAGGLGDRTTKGWVTGSG